MAATEAAMIAAVGWIALGCGFVGLVLAALIVSIEEDTNERKYGNGKETGLKRPDKQG